jgi:hypothetical protein
VVIRQIPFQLWWHDSYMKSPEFLQFRVKILALQVRSWFGGIAAYVDELKENKYIATDARRQTRTFHSADMAE